MKRLAVVAVLLATLASLSRGYQNGAPKEACVSMFPRHQAEAQTSPSPYNIILNTATYTPGSNNTVAVLLTSPQQTFAGVLVEARSAADCGNTNPIGTFLLATNERDLQLLSCMAAGVSSVAADIADTVATHRSKDAVTQKSSLRATSKVFLWHPPVQSSGPVYFRATVVKSKAVFWTSVVSSVLSDTTQRSNLSFSTPPCSSQTTATTAAPTAAAAATTTTTATATPTTTTTTTAAAAAAAATTTTATTTASGMSTQIPLTSVILAVALQFVVWLD